MQAPSPHHCARHKRDLVYSVTSPLPPPYPPPPRLYLLPPCCVGRVSSASRPCIQQVGRSERCLLPTFPRYPHKRWGEVNDAFCQPSPATHTNGPIHLPTPIHPHPPTTPSGLSLSLSPFLSLPGPSVACLPLDLLREKGSSPQKPSPPLQNGDGVPEYGRDADGWVGTALEDRGRCRGGRRQVCCAVVPVCCAGEAGDD